MLSRLATALVVAAALAGCAAAKPTPPETPSAQTETMVGPLPTSAPLATVPGSAQPVATAATAAVAQAGPTIAGCPVFPVDNYWNTPVDHLPLDPNSAAYVAALDPETGLHPDFGSGLYDGGPIGIPYLLIPGGTPRVAISFDYADESDPGPYPIPANPPIEGGPQSDGDRHILLVDQDHCLLYEVYHGVPSGDGTWQAGSGAVFDLRSNALRPADWTSADAAGYPIFAGLVRYDEAASGEIKHALRFTAEAIRDAYTWPARHHAECGGRSADDLTVAPMGQRFRLKASLDISGYPRDVQVILTAMKRYGVVLADCGSNWYISGAPDERWNNDELVASLRNITGSDFEAVDVSSLMIDPNSAQAKQAP